MDFPRGGGAGAMRTRLESPRVCSATPARLSGTTRASRRRQLPTNQCHAALPSLVIRAYQPDSSSKPSHRQPDADVLGKSFTPPRDFHRCRCRSRDRRRPNNRLTTGPSISADDGWSQGLVGEPIDARHSRQQQVEDDQVGTGWRASDLVAPGCAEDAVPLRRTSAPFCAVDVTAA